MRRRLLLPTQMMSVALMNPDTMNSSPLRHADLDPWELQQYLVELQDWELTGEHHMHKSLQFQTCQQALRWHALARELSDRHGRNCLFYLGHVGSGRIEMDILNRVDGHLTRDDLAVAMMLNTLEKEVNRPSGPI